MFSNYAKPGGYVEAVEEACSRLGIPLDRIGSGAGTATREPASALAHYDVVFAKGRAAIEALAVGCAVILCDFAGVGPMVTLSDFDRLRTANFGFGALTRPHDVDVLSGELRRYDPHDAALVCDRIRREASLERYLDDLEEIYQVLIEEAGQIPKPRRSGALKRTGLRAFNAALRNYHRLPSERRRQLRPLTQRLLRAP